MGSDDQPIITLSCPDSAPSNCSVTVSTCDHSEDVGIICTNESKSIAQMLGKGRKDNWSFVKK